LPAPPPLLRVPARALTSTRRVRRPEGLVVGRRPHAPDPLGDPPAPLQALHHGLRLGGRLRRAVVRLLDDVEGVALFLGARYSGHYAGRRRRLRLFPGCLYSVAMVVVVGGGTRRRCASPAFKGWREGATRGWCRVRGRRWVRFTGACCCLWSGA